MGVWILICKDFFVRAAVRPTDGYQRKGLFQCLFLPACERTIHSFRGAPKHHRGGSSCRKMQLGDPPQSPASAFGLSRSLEDLAQAAFAPPILMSSGGFAYRLLLIQRLVRRSLFSGPLGTRLAFGPRPSKPPARVVSKEAP